MAHAEARLEGTNPEILSVNYLRPKTRVVSPQIALSEAAASVQPGGKGRSARVSTGEGGQRKYLGYKILLYYDDKLQAVQAEPARLLQLFPPSGSLVAREPESPPVPASTSTLPDSSQHEMDRSPYATAANFAAYAMKLREEEIGRVPPLNEPTTLHPAPAVQHYPWKTYIVTTVFWIGKKANYRSVWDANWTSNYGGFDNPDFIGAAQLYPSGFYSSSKSILLRTAL